MCSSTGLASSGLIEVIFDTDTVVGDAGLRVRAGGGSERQQAAQTEPHRSYLARATAIGANVRDHRGDVLDALVDVKGGEQLERPLSSGSVWSVMSSPGSMRQEQVGTDGWVAAAAKWSAIARMTALTPKISWMTTARLGAP